MIKVYRGRCKGLATTLVWIIADKRGRIAEYPTELEALRFAFGYLNERAKRQIEKENG